MSQPRQGMIFSADHTEAQTRSEYRRLRKLLRRRDICASGKKRYATESAALTALVRVRKQRIADGEEKPENRAYPCSQCSGWHLSSGELHIRDLAESAPRRDGETWEQYARRLERRIAEQRSQITSLLIVGHGRTNRELRKRIPALHKALANVTEQWQQERTNREALVATLNQKHPFTWLLWQLISRRGGN